MNHEKRPDRKKERTWRHRGKMVEAILVREINQEKREKARMIYNPGKPFDVTQDRAGAMLRLESLSYI